MAPGRTSNRAGQFFLLACQTWQPARRLSRRTRRTGGVLISILWKIRHDAWFASPSRGRHLREARDLGVMMLEIVPEPGRELIGVAFQAAADLVNRQRIRYSRPRPGRDSALIRAARNRHRQIRSRAFRRRVRPGSARRIQTTASPSTPSSSPSRRRAAVTVRSPGRGCPQHEFAHRPPE